MKTGFYFSDPRKQLNKNYRYHGMNYQCVKPPKPGPFDEVETPIPSDEAYFVFTVRCVSATQTSAILEGELVALGTGSYFVLKGFKYWPEGEEEYKIAFEMGEFTSQIYQLEIKY